MAEGRGALLERLLRSGVDTRPWPLGLPESASGLRQRVHSAGRRCKLGGFASGRAGYLAQVG